VTRPAVADAYLRALAANDASLLPTTGSARFTENGQLLELGTGLWATATAVPEHDYASVEDRESAQVAWFGPVEENGRPAVLFARLSSDQGRVAELETIVRREHPRLFSPQSMGEPRAIVFEELDPSERLARSELPAVANAYFDALEQVDGGLFEATDDCIRVENGEQTVLVEDVSHLAGLPSALIFPLGVREQISSGYYGYMDAVRDRRVVAVDEARGLVVLVVVFDHPARKRTVQVKGIGEVEVARYHQAPNSVLIAELFKIRGGRIAHIEAVLEFVPYGSRTGWEE